MVGQIKYEGWKKSSLTDSFKIINVDVFYFAINTY